MMKISIHQKLSQKPCISQKRRLQVIVNRLMPHWCNNFDIKFEVSGHGLAFRLYFLNLTINCSNFTMLNVERSMYIVKCSIDSG